MAVSKLGLVINKTRKDLLCESRNRLILIAILLFASLSIFVGIFKYINTYSEVEKFRKETRENWENRPDKHPHRMAHYGYLVFRSAHPLQIFDSGLDNFLGNVIFLEAHKQNTANLSEAGNSGVLVRFGSFSSAFILQIIVPLVILFLGFGLIAKEREDATLKLLHVQGLSGRIILWGKILGLWQFSLLFLLPLIVLATISSLFISNLEPGDIILRGLIILPAYMIFYFFVCTLTIVVSAQSKTAAGALVVLIGCWLLFVLFLPKSVQFLAQNIYPTPSRIAFETDVEKDVLKVGDSHNPDDPHFKNLKDSVLKKYNVQTVQELPVNYSGIVMKEGEKISSEIYIQHQGLLQEKYNNQQKLSEISGLLNPLTAIKNFSMGLSGTDYYAYTEFQQQAEAYRYDLAQHMNDLQIEHISNTKPIAGEAPAVVSKDNWQQFPDFTYGFTSLKDTISNQWVSALALLFWVLLSFVMVEWSAKKIKLI